MSTKDEKSAKVSGSVLDQPRIKDTRPFEQRVLDFKDEFVCETKISACPKCKSQYPEDVKKCGRSECKEAKTKVVKMMHNPRTGAWKKEFE